MQPDQNHRVANRDENHRTRDLRALVKARAPRRIVGDILERHDLTIDHARDALAALPLRALKIRPRGRHGDKELVLWIALQHGLKNRAPARTGLRLYTADFDSISLGGFYKGRSAFLVLSGPSLNDIDLTQLNRRGIVTMGVNNSWTVHRPTLWTCVDGVS